MDVLLQALINEPADRRPEALAVACRGERLTFGDLEARSSQLARLLRATGVRRDARVGVLSEPTPAALVAVLAILKADAIYVPLDPAAPTAWLARVIASAEPSVLLASSTTAVKLDELYRTGGVGPRVITGSLGTSRIVGSAFCTAFSAGDSLSLSARSPGYRNRAANPAYIMFTAGSDDRPRGVVTTHDSVVRLIRWAVQFFGVRPEDRHVLDAAPSIDFAVFDLFTALAAGASAHVVAPEDRARPGRLVEFVRRAEVTHWRSSGAALHAVAQTDALHGVGLTALRRVLWTGGKLGAQSLAYWMLQVPSARFTRLYGASEATIASAAYDLPGPLGADPERLPVGTACAGEAILVLDEAGRPVPSGATGEICISGAGLSPGYWRDGDGTDMAFGRRAEANGFEAGDRVFRTGDLGQCDAEGRILLVGRREPVVESGSHRVALAEIEAAVAALPEVAAAAVVEVHSGRFGDPMICCAYVPARGTMVTPATLRMRLAQRLPAYMLPFRWKAFDRLPRMAGGAPDRPALQTSFAAALAVA